ncbi:MAG: hypothetical protein M1434_01555 [Chloroflexi bacterium]|nr:hypothetical protein [Chloroflexota bacterium]MCL5273414.1 hypothetical protein [Chloroflexota bacterium]
MVTLLALAACSSPTPLPAPTATVAPTPRPTATARVTPVPLPTSAATALEPAAAQRALATMLADVQTDLGALTRLLQDAQTSVSLDHDAVKRIVARLEVGAGQFDSFLYPESMRAVQAPFHDLVAELRAADQRALDMLSSQPAVNPGDLAALYQSVSARVESAGNALAGLSHGSTPSLTPDTGKSATPVTPIPQPSVQATPAP